MHSLSSRIAGEFIHSRMPSSFHVPGYVLLYLNKGGKFVVDKHECSLSEVIDSVTKLEERLHVAKFFENVEYERPFSQRPATRSSWKPPKHGDIERYGRLLRNEIIDSFTAYPRKRNTSWLDNKAVQWLKKHKNQAVVIDADKGLGDVLMPKSWVSSELKRLLDEGYQKIEAEEYRHRSFLARCALDSVVQHAQDVRIIKPREASFLRQTIFKHREGSFRLRVKLHKSPIVGRPIANMSCSWVAPACLFLCSMLRPIQDELKHTVSSSADFLSNHLPKSVPPNYILATIDVKNLYPSINNEHLIEVLIRAVYRQYGHTGIADFVVQLLKVILQNQFVQHRGEFFQAFGIATGLTPRRILSQHLPQRSGYPGHANTC